MLKKIMMTSSVFITSISTAFASFYLSPKLSYQVYTTDDATYEAWSPSIALGFDTVYNKLYLGGEIIAAPQSISNINSKGTVSLATKYTYGISLLPGVSLDAPVVLYLRGGIVYTNFKSMRGTRMGYQGGVGIDWMLNKCWSLRGEYVHVGYKEIDNVNPRLNEYGIAAVYRFV